MKYSTLEYTFTDADIQALHSWRKDVSVLPDMNLAEEMTNPWYKLWTWDTKRLGEYAKWFPHHRIMKDFCEVWYVEEWYVNTLNHIIIMTAFNRTITLDGDSCSALKIIGIPVGKEL